MVYTYTLQCTHTHTHTHTHPAIELTPPYIRHRYLYVYVLVCGASGGRFSTSALDAYMPLVPQEGSRNNIVPGPGGGTTHKTSCPKKRLTLLCRGSTYPVYPTCTQRYYRC